MSIFTYDVNTVIERLLPPELRTPKRIAWLRVLLRSMQVKWERTFGPNESFQNNLTLLKWDSAYNYSQGEFARVGIKLYECLASSSLNEFPSSNPDKWLLVLDDFVGSNPRVKFTASKITFEFALNLYLNTSPYAVPTIYIQTQGNAYATLMMNSDSTIAPYLNYMPNNSVHSQYFMANVSTYVTGVVNYIIFVPIAVWVGLGSSSTERDNRVRAIANRYNIAGKTYKIQTY